MLMQNKKHMKRNLFLISLFFSLITFGQDKTFSRNSIKTGVGIGYNMGVKEEGLGTISMVGYERSYGSKGLLRLNAALLLGGYTAFGISDSRDNYYRTTSWNLNINYDYLKYKAVSLFIYTGGFANFSRGMLGSGTSQITLKRYESEKFASLYFGGNIGGGIRINPPSNRCAFEIKPINIQFGTKEFVTVYMLFGIDFKIR